ncbi:hypothetical protein Tco_0505437, partial [Tanacetum coccineum]
MVRMIVMVGVKLMMMSISIPYASYEMVVMMCDVSDDEDEGHDLLRDDPKCEDDGVDDEDPDGDGDEYSDDEPDDSGGGAMIYSAMAALVASKRAGGASTLFPA